MSRKITVFLFSLLFIPGSLYPQSALRFGVFPAYNYRTMIRLFSPLALKIEKGTGLPVELVSAPTRRKFNERTVDNRYDIVWTCPACYVKAHAKSGIYAIARGTPCFRGIILVRKGSGIKSIMDLKGKKIAAVSPYSIAGYLFFKEELKGAGIKDKEVTVDFFSMPESIPFEVLKGKYDAGVFSEDTYAHSPFYDKIRGKLQVIAESEPIPQGPFAVVKNLDKNTARKIQTSLVSIDPKNKRDREILKTLGYTCIEKTDDSGYNSFRKMYARLKPK